MATIVQRSERCSVEAEIRVRFPIVAPKVEPKVPEGAERVEWVDTEKLREYDIVPPSLELFKKLGYL